MNIKRIAVLSFVAMCAISILDAQVYQFRGDNHTGKFNETGLLKQWPEGGPKVLLEFTGIGDGYSSVITNGKYIYATGKKDLTYYVTCIDFNGNQKWQVPYGPSWEGSYPNCRGSVTIEGDRLYVIDGEGTLSCLNTETGSLNWKVEVDKIYEAEYHVWGIAESPTIVDNMVLCTPGGKKATMVALNKMTGEEIWKTNPVGGIRGYTSPMLYENNGVRLIIATTASHILAVDPSNGNVRMLYKYFDETKWRHQRNGMIWCTNPVIKGDMVFISVGYDFGARMLKINTSTNTFDEVYSNDVLDSHHHGIVEVNGYLYGANWVTNSSGKWACIEWNTGAKQYETTWGSKGPSVYADGMLYAYDERSGNMGLAEATPAGFNVISSFKIAKGNGEHWSHPFIFDGKMFHRHGNVLTVYDLKNK